MSIPKKKAGWETTRTTCLLKNRGTGIFYTRVRVAGRQVWHSHRTTVREDAELKHADYMKGVRGRRDLSAPRTVGKVTVGALITEYLARNRADVGLKPNTKLYYEASVRRLREAWPALDGLPARSVRPVDLQTVIRTYRNIFSPSSTNGAVVVLVALFRIADELGALVGQSPAKDLKHVATKRKELNLPTVDRALEAIKLYAEQSGDRRGPDSELLMKGLMFTGTRISEARNIRWRHVHEDLGYIQVVGDHVHGTKSGRAASGDKAFRDVPILPAMAGVLAEARVRFRESMKRDPRPDDQVFRYSTCRKALEAVAEILGLPHMTHHDMRHLFISACLLANIDPVSIAEVVGHKDKGKTIFARYSHAFKDTLRARFQALDLSAGATQAAATPPIQTPTTT